jgi:cell division protein FtsZ
MSEVHEAATLIQEEADEEANIIFGTVIDETMGEELKVTVIATGFETGVAESVWKAPRRTVKLVGREDLEKPTFLRVQAREPERIEPLPVIEKPIEEEPLEEFDIPTFLRRRPPGV